MAAELLLAGELFAEALFHCQQAVEKAMKGFLNLHSKPFMRSHDLGILMPACIAIDVSLVPALDDADDLTIYAWRFRYPGAPYEPDAAEANHALQTAALAVREIERRLPV